MRCIEHGPASRALDSPLLQTTSVRTGAHSDLEMVRDYLPLEGSIPEDSETSRTWTCSVQTTSTFSEASSRRRNARVWHVLISLSSQRTLHEWIRGNNWESPMKTVFLKPLLTDTDADIIRLSFINAASENYLPGRGILLAEDIM